MSWLLLLITAVLYSVRAPDDGHTTRRTIWGQNSHFHTGFALNSVIASIYWYVCGFERSRCVSSSGRSLILGNRIVLFIFQIGYQWHLFSSNPVYVQAAASVGSHFIFHNLLTFAFIMLFVRSHFWWAEVLMVIDFFNLSFLYFRHATYPRFIHIPVVSGPLAWTFVAVYWNGAIMVNAHTLIARILANIAVWSILVYGLFFLVVFKVSRPANKRKTKDWR